MKQTEHDFISRSRGALSLRHKRRKGETGKGVSLCALCAFALFLETGSKPPEASAHGTSPRLGRLHFFIELATYPHLLIGQSKRENGDCRLYRNIFPAVHHVYGGWRFEQAAGIEAPQFLTGSGVKGINDACVVASKKNIPRRRH